ncbi:zeta toxin family protein [Rheinheimera oceanensis]|uniref:zeta toxin family protein n=1 Tax=Rheinheimera oceanensis TaxID=2817449 RepID=UPI001BFDCDBE|nr:zeta toxin family protein [Rheinheimera oceanensis]
MSYSASEQAIVYVALEFVKRNKERIAKQLTDASLYPPADRPTAVFMAGAPGAGKTEVSQALAAQFYNTLRIDADEYRSLLPGYDGSNSHLFQGAVSLLVERILDKVFKNKQSFILDGTFSSLKVARKNVDRALRHGHVVELMYVFQSPIVSWGFVEAREQQEGRRILLDTFIEQFLESKQVVDKIKHEFSDAVNVTLLMKDLDINSTEYINVDKCIDDHLSWNYNARQLKEDLLRTV